MYAMLLSAPLSTRQSEATTRERVLRCRGYVAQVCKRMIRAKCGGSRRSDRLAALSTLVLLKAS